MLAEVRAEFDTYREEQKVTVMALRSELDASRASETELAVQHGRAQAEAEFLNEKYDTLMATTAGERDELRRLRENGLKTESLLVDHQRRLKIAEIDLTFWQQPCLRTYYTTRKYQN